MYEGKVFGEFIRGLVSEIWQKPAAAQSKIVKKIAAWIFVMALLDIKSNNNLMVANLKFIAF